MQAEIADFELKTGRRSTADVQNSKTFTGYTVALVTAVTKLTHYMKEVGELAGILRVFGISGHGSLLSLLAFVIMESDLKLALGGKKAGFK